MKRDKVLEAILTIAAGLLLFYFIFKVKVLLFIVFALLVLTLISNFIGEKIAWLWMKFAELLGYVNGKILLSVIFFIVLYPISLIYRLFNKDSLGLKRKSGDSYYKIREHKYLPGDFEHRF